MGEIRVKDESQRFGFGAFKALGGVIAVYNVLSSAVGDAYHFSTSFADVMNGKHKEVTASFVFSTASSGNHGRSVAAGAKLFGNRCVIFLPKFTSAEKEAAIRARGAEVIRVDGDYDTAVAECKRQLAGERLDDHLRHLVGGLRFGAAQRHARLLRAGRGGDRAMAAGADARLRAGRRRRAGRRGDRLSVGGAAAAADLHRRRARERRLLVPEQSSPASRRWPAATPTR